jgi:hypothetical protein
MKLLPILRREKPAQDAASELIREIQDVRGVRVIRLHGHVGMEIGPPVGATDEAVAACEGRPSQPLLFDFSGASGCDVATVACLVQALRRRTASHAQVGIINAPARLIAELEIARVRPLFRLFASEERALAELAREPPSPPNDE